MLLGHKVTKIWKPVVDWQNRKEESLGPWATELSVIATLDCIPLTYF